MLFCCTSARTEEPAIEEVTVREASLGGVQADKHESEPLAPVQAVEESKEEQKVGCTDLTAGQHSATHIPRIFVVAPDQSAPVLLFSISEEPQSDNRRSRSKKKRKSEKSTRKQPSQS